MPLVAHSQLPSFERLAAEGEDVLELDRAHAQDIRELHIGLLNLMPDAALEATERQFMRLVGSCNRIAQFYVHPFTIEGVEREGAARDHVERYYEDFPQLADEGLDALIITGANVTEADITRERFWEPMGAVMDWAREHVCSVYCSCLSSHGAFKRFHGTERRHLERKQWGVYSHRVIDSAHPLFFGTNTRFDTPHSRFNDVSEAQMRGIGLRVLVTSEDAGVLCATSPDGFRYVYFQGHPEYDAQSLLKEYKREIFRFLAGERPDYPPDPENYFDAAAQTTLQSYRGLLEAARSAGRPLPGFPEEALNAHVENTWTDTGKAIFNNWLGLIYQLTDWDRRRPYMAEIDPADPLGLGRAPRAGKVAGRAV